MSSSLATVSYLPSVDVHCKHCEAFFPKNFGRVANGLVEAPPFLKKNDCMLRGAASFGEVSLTVLLALDLEGVVTDTVACYFNRECVYHKLVCDLI